jgi:hypothetical protein
LSHKGDVGEVSENLQLTGIIRFHYQLCNANQNVPHRSTERCSAGLDFQAIFSENYNKIVSLPLCSDRSKNAQLAICGGEESGH